MRWSAKPLLPLSENAVRHVWRFAWFPRRCSDNTWRWLENVYVTEIADHYGWLPLECRSVDSVHVG